MGNGKYLIGRQPILNRSEEIVACELLFRSAGTACARVEDASMATANVIVNTLTGFGLGDILGKHRGFINLELELLMVYRGGGLGRLLRVAELLELLEFEHAGRHLEEIGVSTENVLATQRKAYAWRA